MEAFYVHKNNHNIKTFQQRFRERDGEGVGHGSEGGGENIEESDRER